MMSVRSSCVDSQDFRFPSSTLPAGKLLIREASLVDFEVAGDLCISQRSSSAQSRGPTHLLLKPIED